MVRLSYFLLVFFLSSIQNASEYTFRVLANKGKNQVKRAESEILEELKTGTFLNENDEIILSPDSYVALEHYSGKTIDIREAGISQVNILETDLLLSSANPNSERRKYFNGLAILAAIIFLFSYLIMMSKNKRHSS